VHRLNLPPCCQTFNC